MIDEQNEILDETAEDAAVKEAETKKKQMKKKDETKKRSDELAEKVAALEKELAEKDDRYLRLAAEYDNYRRRSTQERAGVYTEALADTVKSILPILDDLERAGGYTEADKVAEGLTIIARSAATALSKLGVEAFGEVGEAFNADFHNAVLHVDDDAFGECVVAEVLQKGYKKGDKILRYAMVKVAN